MRWQTIGEGERSAAVYLHEKDRKRAKRRRFWRIVVHVICWAVIAYYLGQAFQGICW